MESARRGELAAQQALHEMVRQMAQQLCRGRGPGGGEADWEDVAQIASESLFRVGLDQYRGGMARSYVRRIVLWTILRMAREHRRRRRREETAQVPASAGIPEHPHLDVSLLLSRISHKCRDLLVYVFISGVSYKDLSGHLGLAEASVRSQVSRCLKHARNLAQGDPS